jgi:transposase
MLFVGLDIHHRTSTCYVVNEHGQPMKDYCRTLAGPWERMVGFLQAIDQPLTICFEASLAYGAIHDRLAAFAARVVVAHPGKLRLIYRSKHKNDRADAKALATLLLLDCVPQVHVPGLEVRDWRHLIGFRDQQVRRRTRTKNSLRALLRQNAIAVPKAIGGLWTVKGRAWLAQVPWPTAVAACRAEYQLLELHHYDQAIAMLTKRLNAIGKKHPAVWLLKTIPGVGPRTAEALVAWIDDPQRFRHNRHIGTYFGLVPAQDASGDRNRLGHITKQGPALLRKLLVEAAWQLVRICPTMKARFEQLHGGKQDRRKIAIVAIARQLAVLALAMLKTGEVYRLPPEAKAAADAA